MSPSTITPIRSQSPFETARLALIKKLLEIKPPGGFSIFPIPCEFTAVIDHMREVAGIVDEWCAAIGHEVADNASSRVDIDLFRSPCTDAVTGNALWEIEKQAEQLLEDHNNMLRRA